MQLDILFVPLKKTTFNETSENYNKYLEAGLFKVPLMVIDAFPYNVILRDGDNGIVLNKKDDIIDKIRFFLENKPELTRIGNNAYNSVIENFSVNEQNVEIIDNIYSVDYETENAE